MNNRARSFLMAVSGLVGSFLFAFVVSFSTGLQIPVFAGKPLMWQHILEQLFVFVPTLIALVHLGKVILTAKKKSRASEGHLLLLGVFLIYLASFSLGIHASAQLIGDYFGKTISTFDPQLEWLIFIFDEIVGHLVLAFMPLTLWLVIQAEQHREPIVLTQKQDQFSSALAIFCGVLWAFAGLEGGSMYVVVVPLSLLVLAMEIRENTLAIIKKYPLFRFYFIAVIAMTLVTWGWITLFGWWTQPEAAGLHLFDV